MKLKGVNPVEQHIEKIVLGLVMLLLLAVLSMQFVQTPNNVEVSRSRSVSPDQVYSVLESQAKQIQSQLTDLSPELPEVKSVDLVERYNSAFASSSVGVLALSSPLGSGVDITGASIGGTYTPPENPNGPVGALAVPITSKPVAASQWATLDPYAVIEVPEYEEYVGAVQPFDFPSVTIEATFRGKDLESALLGTGDSEFAIPRRFWSVTGLAILGFEAERQMLLPDGSWGESESIRTPPHTPTPTQAISNEAGLLDLTAVVTKAAGVIDEVARPMFPPTIAGELWIPPSERVVSADDSESTKIKRLMGQLNRNKAELDKLKNGPDTRNNQNTGIKGVRNRNTRTPGPTGNPDRNKKKIERIEKKIKDLEEQLKDLDVELDTDTFNTTRARTRTSSKEVKSILEQDAIDLWTHDLGVTPGATYRYHTRVVVNNPLFRKSSELDPDDADQQALTLDPFARGQWSSWSDPIVVGAEEYFFATKAQPDTGIGSGGAKATVELYKMFYGHYRKSTPSVSPGDELAATIRMSGNLLMFDTSVIDSAGAAKAVAELAEAEKRRSFKLPDGISELSNRLTINLGVYLLEIYTGHGQGETKMGQPIVPMQIVFRDHSGAVVVHSDIEDQNSQAFTLASQSASSASKTPLREPGMSAISPAAKLFEPTEP